MRLEQLVEQADAMPGSIAARSARFVRASRRSPVIPAMAENCVVIPAVSAGLQCRIANP